MKKLGCLAIVGAVLLISIVVAVSSGGGGHKLSPAPVAPSASSPAPKAPVVKDDGPAKPPIQNGDWKLQSVRVSEEDFTHSFTGSARVTYTGTDPSAENAFTVTIFKGGKDVASLTGFANDVAPGKTVTVDLITTDDYVPGPYLYDFQNDW